MTLKELTDIQNAGEFHHATYRNTGTLWEGLWIYTKDKEGFRGFAVAGAFLKDNPELEQAIKQCKGHSFGSFGNG